jgi:hypothetical protein
MIQNSQDLQRASTKREGREDPKEREKIVTDERIKHMPFSEEKKRDDTEMRFW